jgi:hypothetical protein
MLVVRALKNSQLIRQLPDESHVIYGTGHYKPKSPVRGINDFKGVAFSDS